jgi:hypothetical protein
MHSFRQELWVTRNSVIDTIIDESAAKRFLCLTWNSGMCGYVDGLDNVAIDLGSVPLTDPLASKSNF